MCPRHKDQNLVLLSSQKVFLQRCTYSPSRVVVHIGAPMPCGAEEGREKTRERVRRHFIATAAEVGVVEGAVSWGFLAQHFLLHVPFWLLLHAAMWYAFSWALKLMISRGG